MNTSQPTVCIRVPPAPAPEAALVVDVLPDGTSTEEVLEALAATGMDHSDVRARVVVAVAGADALTAASVYAAAVGFTGRWPELHGAAGEVDVAAVHRAGAALADAGRPEEVEELVSVGPRRTGGRSWDSVAGVSSPAEVSALRWARRVVLTGCPPEAERLVLEVAALSGMRSRAGRDPMPMLAPSPERTVDLEEIRRAAAALRRTVRHPVESTEVDPAPVGPGTARLAAAADVPVEAVLRRLGSEPDPVSGRWRCPRPSRHTAGDRNPSMAVSDDGATARCFRCDAEWVDALWLVMDATGLPPADAADWVLSGPDVSVGRPAGP